jgi:hypothetical protein
MGLKRLACLSPLTIAVLAGCGGPAQSLQMLPENDSGQTGTAALYDKGIDTEVDLDTYGGADKNPQLAHIRIGHCPDDGRATGFILENLQTVVNGQSTTRVLNRNVMDLIGGRYHICIQNSGDPSECASCGDIP